VVAVSFNKRLRGIRPIVLTSDATVGDAMEALARHKISSLPVVSPDSRCASARSRLSRDA